MGHPGFGLEIKGPDYIKQTLENARRLDWVTAKLLLLDRYESTYGICLHDDVPDHEPLKVSAFHEANSNLKHSSLFSYIDRFEKLKIGTTWGLSLMEFLELPRDIADELLERTVVRLQTKQGQYNQIEAQLRNELNKEL